MFKSVFIPCLLVTVFCFGGGFLMAHLAQSPDQKYVRDKENMCKVVESIPTDEKIYCGKACLAPAVLNVYQCSEGKVLRLLERSN